ncbi:hypothetical protein SAMN05444678_1018 [Sphingomonas sp. YR710]|uniref:AAA family ATPase n=1 Tax=Sphingomonas sp. YR710 TaxID=1882773 RepID=UPI00088BA3CB|nr:ATP-binding protein [Sphingomonas sp. YR710]SDB98082.1 hypothetical protein SAMN05444678_1018 [Sphingomonas sp. YR710]
MLVSFWMENFKSFRDRVEISLIANGADRTFPSAVIPAKTSTGGEIGLLPAVAFYGPNASGKTNLLMGIDYLKAAIAFSQPVWKPASGTYLDPNVVCPETPSTFEINVLLDGVRFRYGFEVHPSHFSREWLFSYPKGRERELFQRITHRLDDTFDTSAEIGSNLTGERRDHLSSLRRTRENSLFLSSLAQDNQDEASKVYKYVRGWNTAIDRPQKNFSEMTSFLSFRINTFKELTLSLLKLADPSIQDIEISEIEDNAKSAYGRAIDNKHYKASFITGVAGNRYGMPFENQSRGIKKLYTLCADVVWGLQMGQLVVVDEIETSMHPHISARLISLFQDSSTNPKNAQLIFATHETRLLSLKHLRRDQIWFVDKQDGLSTVYSLLEFSPRKDENFELGYLTGRYGSIPTKGLDPQWYETIKQVINESEIDEQPA